MSTMLEEAAWLKHTKQHVAHWRGMQLDLNQGTQIRR